MRNKELIVFYALLLNVVQIMSSFKKWLYLHIGQKSMNKNVRKMHSGKK